jgi:Cysteine-rich CPCC
MTFDEPPGSYDICELCGWEDDHVQLAHPEMAGGANRISLVQAQEKAITEYPLNVWEAKGYQRDSKWRLWSSKDQANAASSPESGSEYFEAAASEEPYYYWKNNIYSKGLKSDRFKPAA